MNSLGEKCLRVFEVKEGEGDGSTVQNFNDRCQSLSLTVISGPNYLVGEEVLAACRCR